MSELVTPRSLEVFMTFAADAFERHRSTLEQAVEATRTRGYFSAYPESPSPRIYGETSAAAGLEVFQALLGKEFPVLSPGSAGTVSTEKSPYGIPLHVAYPRVSTDGVDALVAAATA